MRIIWTFVLAYWALINAPAEPERYDGEATDTWAW